MGAADRVSLPYQPASPAADGARLYHAESAGHTLDLTVAPRRCIDPMSGAVFSRAADLVVDGRSFKGCAYEGGPS